MNNLLLGRIGEHQRPFGTALVLTMALFCSIASAVDPTIDLRNAVGRLEAQLGSGPQAEGWRRYLQLNRLETQAARGEQADIRVLTELHQRLVAVPEGSQFQPLSDVRVALENQIRNLSLLPSHDVPQLLQDASHGFRPISIGEIDELRNRLLGDLSQLVAFNNAQPFHPTRNAALDSLQIPDLARLLSEIEIELAPEVSEGKLNSNLDTLRGQLKEVTDKIDALPYVEEDEDEPQPDRENGQEADQPQPDENQDDLASLRLQERSLTSQIEELTQRRNEIRQQDRPRKTKRSDYLKRLLEFEERFEKAANDLRDPYCTSSHYSLDRFSKIYRFGTEDNLQEDYLKRIELLTTDLNQLSSLKDDRRTLGAIGFSLEWLENAGQAPSLVAAIRARLSNPNAYVHVSGEFLNRVGGRPVNQTQPVHEDVKGKPLSGIAHTSGTVSFDLVDDPDQVHVSIRSLNQIQTDARLDQSKHLKVFLQSYGNAEARRSIVANFGGLYDGEAYGAANMDSQFGGTSMACNLVNKVASKKFAEAKNDGDVRAASRVRNEMLEKFTEETDKAIAEGRESLQKLKNAQLNFFNQVPAMFMHTGGNRIHVVAKQHSRWNLAAPDVPARFASHSDIELRIHDSLLSNYAEPFFRGKTFTNEELAEELKKHLKTTDNPIAPRAIAEDEPEEEPFSITFSNVRPVQFELDNNLISAVISATKFTRGGRTINAGLTITIRFKIVQENGNLFLAREGKAELDYIPGQEKSAELVAFRSILNEKLNPPGVEQEEARSPLPDQLLPVDQFPALKDRKNVRDLLLSQCRMEGGWLYLGWNHSPAGSAGSARPVDLPAISPRETAHFSDQVPGRSLTLNFSDQR